MTFPLFRAPRDCHRLTWPSWTSLVPNWSLEPSPTRLIWYQTGPWTVLKIKVVQQGVNLPSPCLSRSSFKTLVLWCWCCLRCICSECSIRWFEYTTKCVSFNIIYYIFPYFRLSRHIKLVDFFDIPKLNHLERCASLINYSKYSLRYGIHQCLCNALLILF
jgi:hypothetical protein